MAVSPSVILHTDNPQASLELFQQQHTDLPVTTCDSYEALPELIRETAAEVVYSVCFNGREGFPRDALLNSNTVKWVSVSGSGTDHLNPWNEDKVTVTNSAGVAAEMMAEYVLGTMLHFSLKLDQFREAQQQNQWIMGQVEPLAGKTILIVGLGKTGQAVAKVTKGIGLRTLGVRARPSATSNVYEVFGMEALPELWGQADYVVICVPLLNSTRGMVNKESFRAMKNSAVFIDVSRGNVVDEVALIAALDDQQIKGAVLDVFAVEPLPADNKLWSYDNVIITPHCSSVYQGWDLKSASLFSENMTRYRRGEALSNIVDPVRGY